VAADVRHDHARQQGQVEPDKRGEAREFCPRAKPTLVVQEQGGFLEELKEDINYFYV
jgi:hypothetical protein